MRLACALVICAVFAQVEYEADINGIKQMCSILGFAGKCVVLGPSEVVATVIFAKAASELGENGSLIAPAAFGPGSTVTTKFGTKLDLLVFTTANWQYAGPTAERSSPGSELESRYRASSCSRFVEVLQALMAALTFATFRLTRRPQGPSTSY